MTMNYLGRKHSWFVNLNAAIAPVFWVGTAAHLNAESLEGVQVQCCFMSTETIRTIRDEEQLQTSTPMHT